MTDGEGRRRTHDRLAALAGRLASWQAGRTRHRGNHLPRSLARQLRTRARTALTSSAPPCLVSRGRRVGLVSRCGSARICLTSACGPLASGFLRHLGLPALSSSSRPQFRPGPLPVASGRRGIYAASRGARGSRLALAPPPPASAREASTQGTVLLTCLHNAGLVRPETSIGTVVVGPRPDSGTSAVEPRSFICYDQVAWCAHRRGAGATRRRYCAAGRGSAFVVSSASRHVLDAAHQARRRAPPIPLLTHLLLVVLPLVARSSTSSLVSPPSVRGRDRAAARRVTGSTTICAALPWPTCACGWGRPCRSAGSATRHDLS